MGRIAILGSGLLLFAGCGGGGGGAPAAAADAETIACRIGPSGSFERVCTAEPADSGAGPTIIVRRPDGGFRRLRVADDGRGVVAADGAEPAEVTIVGAGTIEVEIGGDAFRLPATVRAQ